jgi:prepilin-type N-terminal cleavage/methylation domain-containing protein
MYNNNFKKKQGFTLIELIVAMAIFTTVISLAIGSFITIMNLEALGTNVSNSQQKVRVAMEQISRLARQATNVNVTNSVNGSDRTVQFYFLNQTPQTAMEFTFYAPNNWAAAGGSLTGGGTLYVYNCAAGDVAVTNGNPSCSGDSNWTTNATLPSISTGAMDLLGGINNNNILKLYDGEYDTETQSVTNAFALLPNLPPTLSITMNGKLPSASASNFFNNSMVINTEVVMDNIQ